jgi:hypothetical protein
MSETSTPEGTLPFPTTTSLALVPTAQAVTKPPAAIADEVMEALVMGGDFSRLTPAQRIMVYKAKCEAAGIDPRCQPFAVIKTREGKQILYALKTASDQLTAARRLTVEIIQRVDDVVNGIYEVEARVTFPDGQRVTDYGAVSTAGLKGENLCNARMKAVTKAKRRTILSACGLGVLDDSEVDSIPGATRVSLEDAMSAPAQTNGGKPTLPPEGEAWPMTPRRGKAIERLATCRENHDLERKDVQAAAGRHFQCANIAFLSEAQLDELIKLIDQDMRELDAKLDALDKPKVTIGHADAEPPADWQPGQDDIPV